MSRPRDIAIEFFGEIEGQKMADADIYQRLARDVVEATVVVEISIAGDFLDNVTAPDEYLKDARNEALFATPNVIGQAAYAIGYKAQLADATAEKGAERYGHLNDLAAMYRMIQSNSSTKAE